MTTHLTPPATPPPVTSGPGQRQTFDAVAIGASAGGVDALITLLASLPAAFEPAVIVVQHLPAQPATTLPQLLAAHCVLPVREAEASLAIENGTVVVAPNGYHLLVEPDFTLSLSLDEPVHYSRPSIDLMFESAAMAYQERLLGIILTGANDDGAAGLLAIREMGGMTWAQDPQQAVAEAMPAAAIAAGAARRVLTLEQMARQLQALARHV